MALTLDQLAGIVANATFNELVGEVEGQFLDVKSQPYKFAEGLDAKREFAKDVAAFANAKGGYILIGFTTQKTPLRPGEEIVAPNPIPSDQFNIEQYIKLLEEWLYPRPVDVDIKFGSFGADANKGILVVFIPPQAERSKPFLITKTFTDKKTTEVFLGYAERRLDFTAPMKVAELHHALRVGLSLERELLGRIDNLEMLITEHFSSNKQAEEASKASAQLQERITKLLNEEEG
jgi:predicted HTH transcriptional regulator